MLNALSVGMAIPERRNVRTQPHLFRLIAEYAEIDFDRRYVPKSLIALFDEMMTTCGQRGVWEWEGSKRDFRRHVTRPRPNEEQVDCGRDVLVLLRSLARYCAEVDGVCRVHGMTVICMAFQWIGEISYDLQGDYVHVQADEIFANYVNVDVDVWFEGLDAEAAWRSSYELVEVRSEYNSLHPEDRTSPDRPADSRSRRKKRT